MTSNYKRSDALDAFIRENGGVITETSDGRAVDFPGREQEPAEEEPQRYNADQIERAIERAKEYGTTIVPLWRPRGDGYYAASSHAEHPGCAYVCRIDETTGTPISCECAAGTGSGVCCHHLGAAIALFRERVGWYRSEAVVGDMWEETLRRLKACRPERLEGEEL
ncbi:MAG: hypothetical protein KGL39_47620 [Patescibacteria group bacterium]|nr:hypothetical protein [Patescibacteria group bacterium]